MRKPKPTRKHLGEMRTFQLITSYGVGAMVDFKDEAAILAEADAWYRPYDNDERKIRCHNLEKCWARNCGYQASSMKERIYSTYADGQPMAGLLIYTTAADTEGSLGGLVGQAEHLGEHLDALLNEAEWCSSDPLCLMSSGKNAQGLFGLNYAACPQCALFPETSCSMRNSLLDRGALIGRSQDSTIGYFNGIK